jgi:hypothetical protein
VIRDVKSKPDYNAGGLNVFALLTEQWHYSEHCSQSSGTFK